MVTMSRKTKKAQQRYILQQEFHEPPKRIDFGQNYLSSVVYRLITSWQKFLCPWYVVDGQE